MEPAGIDGHPRHLIVDSLGENFGFAKVVEDSSELSEGRERSPTVQPEIDTLLDRFATLG